MIAQGANWLIVSWGWRRFLIAFLMGALLALTQAPVFFIPALFIALPIFVLLMDSVGVARDDGRQTVFWSAFSLGWWFGFGYFLAGLWWIGFAFLVDAEQFAWLLPFAIVLMPAGLALFWALGVAIARKVLWSNSAIRIAALAVGLGIAEIARAHLFTGFPWNALGLALMPHPIAMQSAAFVGLEGMTVLAVLIGASPVVLIKLGQKRFLSTQDRSIVGLAVVLCLVHVGLGGVRLATSDVQAFDGVQLRVVQPAIPQHEKWLPEKRGEVFNRYLELSDRAVSPEHPGLDTVTHLIWPEAAFPFLLTEEPGAVAALAALLPDQTTLIAGAIRKDPASGTASDTFYNSVYAIGSNGEILASYDKVHLVPFGEYLPFQSTLESLGLRQVTQLKGGFAAGPDYRAISSVAGTPPFLPLICYEILFSREARLAAGQASWIVNVTNDAWFGDSPGPRQHLHLSQIRAVVDGLAVVRAANTGISAVIDPYGRITDRLALGVSGVIDASLPQPIGTAPPAANYALMISIVLIAMLIFSSLIIHKYSSG